MSTADNVRGSDLRIGRDKTERLLRLAGVRGVKMSKRVFTALVGKEDGAASDLINRKFTADGPRRLWVCDVTYAATWSGFAYVATRRSEILPLHALDMAVWAVGGRLDDLIHHADHGSNYMAMVYTIRNAELGAVPTWTVGESFDNALARAINHLCKSELIRQRSRPERIVLDELPPLASGPRARQRRESSSASLQWPLVTR